MIKIENVHVFGWEGSITGMRNPMNSWNKSDSTYDGDPIVGEADLNLMKRLFKAGMPDRKYARMLHVQLDIVAPLYWWKEFKTYTQNRKFLNDEQDVVEDNILGVAPSWVTEPYITMNSCSTMHKIQSKKFTLDDFSHEHLMDMKESSLQLVDTNNKDTGIYVTPESLLEITCSVLNQYRELFLKTKDKAFWWQMIQLLPSSYNQRRTVDLGYECLFSQHYWRKNHKLDEWREYCKWIESLPYMKDFLEVLYGKELHN